MMILFDCLYRSDRCFLRGHSSDRYKHINEKIIHSLPSSVYVT